MFERLEDGRLHFQSISQTDFNATGGKLATVTVINQLPKNLTKWRAALEEHLA